MATSDSIIYYGDLIQKVHEQVFLLRSAGIDLTASTCPIPPANLIYDILHAAGIPDGGIAIALGKDITTITGDDPLEPVPCCVCGQPAADLVNTRSGFLLSCDLHATEAIHAGLTVLVTPIYQ